MELTIRQMIGQKTILGFHGPDLPEDFEAFIREYQVGHVILFQRNVQSADQLYTLCQKIRRVILEATGFPPFIVIDQEGGLVSRIPPDAVNVPSAMALGATGNPENAFEAAKITARQLRGLGPNFTMAPVLDVNSNADNPVIGVRSYGDDPRLVAVFGEAAVRGYEDSGVLCCGKHFPGHGDTSVDSHVGLPCVDKTVEELEKMELIPFRRAIEAGIPAIMSTHILFPKIEPDKVPGTMSRKIITGLLKERLGFQGLVFTDCLEMNAIQEFYGAAKGMVEAFRAGVDLAEISSTFSLECDAVRYANEVAEQGGLDMDEMRASVKKILAFKEKLADYPLERSLCNQPKDREASRKMARQALCMYDGTPFAVTEKTFFCGCADYRTTEAANLIACVEPFAEYMTKHFGGGGMTTGKNPQDEEVHKIVNEASRWDNIVLATCNAHLYTGQLELAKALAATGKPLMIVTTRNPYDLPKLPACACKIAAFDYTKDCFDALIDVFQGAPLTGTMPVSL